MTHNDALIRNEMQLDLIKEYLDTLSFETNLVKRSEDIPYDTLFSIIERKEEEKDPISICYNFISSVSSYIKSLDLLQLIVFLPCIVTADNRSSVLKLLNEINHKLTVGNFIIVNSERIVLKYVYLVPTSKIIDEDNFKEAVLLYVYMYDLFSPIIVSLANGEKSLSSSLKDI